MTTEHGEERDDHDDGSSSDDHDDGHGSDDHDDGHGSDDHDDGHGSDDHDEAANGLILTERSTDEGLLVSICDDDCLGETFEEGEISLTVTEEFYGGDAVAADAAVASLQRATVANIVGERAVGLAIEHGFVEEGNVLEVGGTRHAQVLSLR